MGAATLTWFGPDGRLAQALESYRPRTQQAEMAVAVAKAIETGGRLVVEAGTGTGKSLAYLIPALLSGRKVLISTATRTLQEQLFHQSVALVRTQLSQPVQVALLKGRSNYLCLHRLELTTHQGLLRSPPEVRRLQDVVAWAGRTQIGDLAEVGDPGDGSPLWHRVSSTADNCLSGECPRYSDCYVLKARRRAQEADVVLVNHHLLFADLALREEGFGELLPGAEAIVLDEAHQLPQVAGQFFGAALSGRQLAELANDAQAEYREKAGDSPEFFATLAAFGTALARTNAALAGPTQRLRAADVLALPGAEDCLQTLLTALAEFRLALTALAPHLKELESLAARATELESRLQRWQERDADYIRWAERHPQGFVLYLTPFEIATRLGQVFSDSPAAWILTSATLTVGGSFEHFLRSIGLEDAVQLMLESPYDYPNHALLYLPKGLPDPNSSAYGDAVAAAALPVIRAAGGGAFVLCTSQRAVQQVAALLRAALPFVVLAQGESGRHTLLEQFRADGDAVLVGTSSFWEGVDVRGAALRLVIIDRLPFGSPGDPVMQARIERVRENEGDPFLEFQLPQAVLALKQGAGRLIRDEQDRGVLMICDPRLQNRGYGKSFLLSLPPMRRSRQLDEAIAFFTP
ncbi:MAG: ATP-dependent DNA helicase [Nevskiales bacterium]